MKIAPIDIAHKTFARKVMGLDADEVTDFLRDVADQMEELNRERNSLKEALRQKDLQLMEFKERDETLKATLSMATKMSEQIRQDSEREAKLITNDAHQKADIILRDSRDSLKRTYQEISDLKRTRMQFEVNLRALCQAHVAMLDQSHLMMPDPQINLAQANASLAGPAGSATNTTTAPGAQTNHGHAAATSAPASSQAVTPAPTRAATSARAQDLANPSAQNPTQQQQQPRQFQQQPPPPFQPLRGPNRS